MLSIRRQRFSIKKVFIHNKTKWKLLKLTLNFEFNINTISKNENQTIQSQLQSEIRSKYSRAFLVLLAFAFSLAQDLEKELGFSSDYSLSLQGCTLGLINLVRQATVTL